MIDFLSWYSFLNGTPTPCLSYTKQSSTSSRRKSTVAAPKSWFSLVICRVIGETSAIFFCWGSLRFDAATLEAISGSCRGAAQRWKFTPIRLRRLQACVCVLVYITLYIGIYIYIFLYIYFCIYIYWDKGQFSYRLTFGTLQKIRANRV